MWNVLIMLVALKISIPTPIGACIGGAREAFIEGLQTIVTVAANCPSDFEGL